MTHLWILLHSQLVWTWKSISSTEYMWAAIGLLATGWFLSALRRA